MYIQFAVKFPERNWTADPDAFEALRKILPGPTIAPPAEAMTEPADLEDMDVQQQTKAFGGGAGMEDEDEDGHPHAERVQCASQ
jgi:DnaJ family protein A protein 2